MPEHSHRILIVEDNTMMQTFYRNVLKGLPVDVVFACNGEDAVSAAREVAPHLILMDINMPKLDGVSATKLIRDQPGLLHTPVIAVTARQVDDYTSRAGFTAHLKKPLRADDLKDAVCNWLKIPAE